MPFNTVMALAASLVAILSSGAAVWLIVTTFADAVRMQASAAWPAVEGIVNASSVETFWSDTAGRTYIPCVSYTYVVDGTPRQGSDVRIGGFITSSDVAEQVVRDHPAGAAVKVFVDPSDPGRAVLQPALPGTFINRPFLALGAGLVSWLAQFFALVSISSRAIDPSIALWVLAGLLVASLICLAGGAGVIARHRHGYPRYAMICGVGLMAIGAVAIVMPLIVMAYRLRS